MFMILKSAGLWTHEAGSGIAKQVAKTSRLAWIAAGALVVIGILHGGLVWLHHHEMVSIVGLWPADVSNVSLLERADGVLLRGLRNAAITTLVAGVGLLVLLRILERTRLNVARMEGLATVGTLAASIAHEIKNPMGIILSTSQHLSVSPRLSEHESQLLLDICEEVRRIDDQINAFLDLVRDVPLRSERVDLCELAMSTIGLLAAQARQADVKVKVSMPDEPVAIIGDRRRLRQALINPFLNSIQSMVGRGGTILVTVRRCPETKRGICEIEDDGPGIPQDRLRQVMQPFYTTKLEGTGLGLSITNRILERHGGQFQLQSEPEVGTTACLILPSWHSEESEAYHQGRLARI